MKELALSESTSSHSPKSNLSSTKVKTVWEIYSLLIWSFKLIQSICTVVLEQSITEYHGAVSYYP